VRITFPVLPISLLTVYVPSRRVLGMMRAVRVNGVQYKWPHPPIAQNLSGTFEFQSSLYSFLRNQSASYGPSNQSFVLSVAWQQLSSTRFLCFPPVSSSHSHGGLIPFQPSQYPQADCCR
jgi:hypothetical protein